MAESGRDPRFVMFSPVTGTGRPTGVRSSRSTPTPVDEVITSGAIVRSRTLSAGCPATATASATSPRPRPSTEARSTRAFDAPLIPMENSISERPDAASTEPEDVNPNQSVRFEPARHSYRGACWMRESQPTSSTA